ncbi:CehA/McbA family metallohydrolase [uncultured Imperialibacter sp.]|uniref:CehA/McbA family metallohydrolase n=1 Tax=uncultured Imperialibacter sp. TaxID=1672639 RepID=UPI0030D9F5EA
MKPTQLFLATLLLCATAQAQDLKVYFGNLHSHTSYSDGSGTPDEAYKHARDVAGLDFLAVTEHNHKSAKSKIADSPELYNGNSAISLKSYANSYTKNGEFVAIYGQEFSSISSGNHGNVLEADAVIQTTDVPNGEWDKLLTTWLPAHKDSRGKDAILFLTHPATSSSPNAIEYGIDDFPTQAEWLASLDQYAQLMNIINGPSHQGTNPAKPSESEFKRYLNMGLHVAPTADQDNHRRDWGSVADTRTAVIAPSLDKASILDALASRHVYATQDKNLEIVATINGKLIGSILSDDQLPSVGSELTISISINDSDEPMAYYTVDVYADKPGGAEQADVIKEERFSGNGTFNISGVKYAGGSQYFYIKVIQTDDDAEVFDMAWLAPVWFEPSTAAPATAATHVTLSVNPRTEVATITNIGSQEVDLKKWKLVSTVGDQQFEFPAWKLKPGESVDVVSGSQAAASSTAILWKKQYIWNNDADPGELYDKNGQLVASTN